MPVRDTLLSPTKGCCTYCGGRILSPRTSGTKRTANVVCSTTPVAVFVITRIDQRHGRDQQGERYPGQKSHLRSHRGRCSTLSYVRRQVSLMPR